MGPTSVHVLDTDFRRRAALARALLELGHHTEIYADANELLSHPPSNGVVIAFEDAVREGISGLSAMVNRDGRWLAIIAASATPSIDKAVAAIKQGALGYIGHPMDAEQLSRSVQAAEAEACSMRQSRTQADQARSLIELLSPRENEVLDRVANGLTSKQIGEELGISVRTVEIHRTNALAKIEARNSADAVRMWWVAAA